MIEYEIATTNSCAPCQDRNATCRIHILHACGMTMVIAGDEAQAAARKSAGGMTTLLAPASKHQAQATSKNSKRLAQGTTPKHSTAHSTKRSVPWWWIHVFLSSQHRRCEITPDNPIQKRHHSTTPNPCNKNGADITEIITVATSKQCASITGHGAAATKGPCSYYTTSHMMTLMLRCLNTLITSWCGRLATPARGTPVLPFRDRSPL
jgi:hypothetical protein